MKLMPGGDLFFVDTNVLLYSCDSSQGKKRLAAREWLDFLWHSGSGRLSWQVLHEFYSNAVKKLHSPPPETRRTVEAFAHWEPVETSLGLIQRGWHWMDAARLSYWDSLIAAAAERAGCRYLLSEDFQSGQTIGSVTVVSPFLSAPADFVRPR